MLVAAQGVINDWSGVGDLDNAHDTLDYEFGVWLFVMGLNEPCNSNDSHLVDREISENHKYLRSTLHEIFGCLELSNNKVLFSREKYWL